VELPSMLGREGCPENCDKIVEKIVVDVVDRCEMSLI
jgi:hypothetical protein